MLNLICLTKSGHLKFIGKSCRTRVECELQLLRVLQRHPFLDQARFFIASDSPRKAFTLHQHYVSNVAWLAAKLNIEEQEYREQAWRDRRHLPLSLTQKDREHLALALAQSLVDSLLESENELTPELLLQELKGNWSGYLKFAGIGVARRLELERRFQEIVNRTWRRLQGRQKLRRV